MRKLLLFASVVVLLVGGLPQSHAGPTAGGFASDNVEYVGYVPFEAGTATGARIVDDFMYVTSWRSISIYDVSSPGTPKLVSTTPIGFQFENEDVPTNGKILLFSESLPRSVLHVWDVSDKAHPREIATVPRAGDHTATCILDCTYSYGSDGSIVDLRDPKNPKLVGDWHAQIGMRGDGHDVTEVTNGFIVTAPIDKNQPIQLLDVRNPLKPKVLGSELRPDNSPLIHSVEWPNDARDQFLLVQAERNFRPRCQDDQALGPRGGFMTYQATTLAKGFARAAGKRAIASPVAVDFKLIDHFKIDNGVMVDGRPPVNALGCSAHWFQVHPTFDNGGLVAAGWYEHGTRFLEISPKGKISEVGWFLPYGGSTSAAYWADEEVVYAIDYTRGFDILRFKGEVP